MKKNSILIIISLVLSWFYPVMKEYIYSMGSGNGEYVEFYNSMTSKGSLTESEMNELMTRSNEYRKQASASVEKNVGYAIGLIFVYLTIFTIMIYYLFKNRNYYSATFIFLMLAVIFM